MTVYSLFLIRMPTSLPPLLPTCSPSPTTKKTPSPKCWKAGRKGRMEMRRKDGKRGGRGGGKKLNALAKNKTFSHFHSEIYQNRVGNNEQSEGSDKDTCPFVSSKGPKEAHT